MKYFVLVALLGLIANSECIKINSYLGEEPKEEKPPVLEEKKVADDPVPDTGVKNVKVPGKSAAEKQADKDKVLDKKSPKKEEEKKQTPEEIEVAKKAADIEKEKSLAVTNQKKVES